jgi:predicted nucleic acid-binding protein
VKIVDASAMIDMLTGGPRADQLVSILDDDLFAPELLVPEVLAFFRRMVAGQRIPAAEADELTHVLQSAPIEFVSTWPYTARLGELRHVLTPYDACYVAVAEEVGAPLVTTDLRLARAATGVVPVIVV